MSYADTIDGIEGVDIEIAQWDAIAEPSVAPTNSGRIYYNGTSDDLRLSLNGGAYSPLITSSSGGSTYYKLDGSNSNNYLYLSSNTYLRKIDTDTVGLYVNTVLVQEWSATTPTPGAGSAMGIFGYTYSS
jgi:hypothetical protein